MVNNVATRLGLCFAIMIAPPWAFAQMGGDYDTIAVPSAMFAGYVLRLMHEAAHD